MGPPPAVRGRAAARLNGAEVYQDPPRRVARGYGRGSRPRALRTARAPTERPISVSSAVAWTTVETSSLPEAGIGLRERGAGGVPEGCCGCRSGSERGRRFGARRGAFDAFTRLGAAGVGAPGSGSRAARPPRLSLRRCGRVRGREPRISGGGSSAIAAYDRARAACAGRNLKRIGSLYVLLSKRCECRMVRRRPAGPSSERRAYARTRVDFKK